MSESQAPQVPSPEAMTAEAEQQMRLLWDPPPPPTRGPRRALGLDDVVDAAVRLADAGGLEALSMRKVAAELGIGAMSVYTYVPGRDELIELMIDRTNGTMPLPDADRGWREAVRAWAVARHALFVSHGWLLDATTFRDVLGPHVMKVQEALFAALVRAGLDASSVVGTSSAMEWFVQGAAGVDVGEQAATRRTGQTTDQYYEARAGFWSTYFRWEEYPMHVRLWQAGVFEDTAAFDFETNLDAFLDGIELRVQAAD